MKHYKIYALLFAVIVKICVGEVIVRTGESAKTSKLVEATVKILTSCYRNKGNGIGIVRKFPETFLAQLQSRQLRPVVLINNNTKIAHNVKKILLPHRKTGLDVIVIVASDKYEIMNGMTQLINTPWHNHMASYLVLIWSPVKHYGCSRAVHMLFILWKLRIYNANVVCLHRLSGAVTIYGYNPHTNQAPKPWQRIMTMRKKPKGFFTVFRRAYTEGEEMCGNLDFDKTIDLGGDPIDLLTWRLAYDEEHVIARTNRKYVVSRLDNILTTFIRHMNATLIISVRYLKNRRTFLLDDIKDISKPFVYEETVDSPKSYPIGQQGQLIMTQFRGYKTQLNKILGVIDSNSQIGVCLVFLITVIFFKVFVRQSFPSAILNVLRVTCNVGFMNLPENLTSRVYVGCVLFFVLTMQGIFSGNLATLLTFQIPLRHPTTMNDLVDFGYTIYTSTANVGYFADPKFEGHIVVIRSTTECLDIVLKDPSAACVGTDWHLKDEAAHNNLYVSNDIIIKHYYGFRIALWWPMLDRLNKILSIMEEADIRASLPLRVFLTRLSEKQISEMNYVYPKVMTWEHLRFAFVILGIGLTLATISFVIEIAIGRIRSRVAGVRRNIRLDMGV